MRCLGCCSFVQRWESCKVALLSMNRDCRHPGADMPPPAPDRRAADGDWVGYRKVKMSSAGRRDFGSLALKSSSLR
ncbi:hypothetical protein GCM10027398_46870 [Azotobacter salinestris]